MFRHILVPTDFGEPSQRALTCAVDMARRFDSRLTLLHVYGVPTVYYPDDVAWPLAQLGKAAQASLDAAVAQTRKLIGSAQGHVEVGDPRERILAYAVKKHGIDTDRFR